MRVTLMVIDIDPTAIQEEVLEAVSKMIPGQLVTVVSLRAGYGGMQRALVNCEDNHETRKLLKM